MDVRAHHRTSGVKLDRSAPADVSDDRPEHVVIGLVQEWPSQVEQPRNHETQRSNPPDLPLCKILEEDSSRVFNTP